MAEKQSWVLFSTSATAEATDDSTKRLGQRKRQHGSPGAVATVPRTRCPEVESDSEQRPKVGNRQKSRRATSGRQIGVENVEIIVNVDEDSAKSSWKLRQTTMYTSVHHGSSLSKYAVLAGAWLLYPEFLLRSRTPPGGGPGGGSKIILKRNV